MGKFYLYLSLVIFAVIFLTACEKSDPVIEEPEETLATDVTVPLGAALVVDKDFQTSGGAFPNISALSYGFAEGADECAASGMIAATEPITWEEAYLNGVNNDSVFIEYTDVALSTTCETGAGPLPGGHTISKGFIVFAPKSSRSGNVQPTVELKGIPTAMVVQFTLTAEESQGAGITLYQSAGGAAYKAVGTLKPAANGEFYSIAVEGEDLSLKFASEDAANGLIRLHDLKVYTDGVPENSVLYVDEYFNTWTMTGYQQPYPDPISKNGTNLVPTVTIQSVAFDVTKTYYTGLPVTFSIKNGAVYPKGYNHHGDTSLVYGLTKGYVELPPASRTFDKEDASLTISAVPSVSLFECWIAATGMSGQYNFYKSTDGGKTWTLFNETKLTKYAGIGKYFRFWINDKNVSFRITPNPEFTGTPKVYGVRIWSNGKP